MEQSELIPILNKAIMDELTASIAYKLLAEKVINAPTLSEELRKHATDEMNHFNTVVDLASARGMCDMLIMKLDESVLTSLPSEKFQVIAKVQRLELNAIDDYAGAVMAARRTGDLEVERIFMELLKDEQEHYDDLAQYTGEHR